MWEDELFDEIRKGDTVWYKDSSGSNLKGKAILFGPMGWVLKTEFSTSQVVMEGDNYLGHTPGKGERVDVHLGKFLNA